MLTVKMFVSLVGTIPEQLGHCCCHLQSHESRSRSSSGGEFPGPFCHHWLKLILICLSSWRQRTENACVFLLSAVSWLLLTKGMSHCESWCYIKTTTVSVCVRKLTVMVTVMNNGNRTELSCPLFEKSHTLVNFTTTTESCHYWLAEIDVSFSQAVTLLRYLPQVPPSRPLSCWELGFRAPPP